MAGLEKNDERWLRYECKRRGGFCIKLDGLFGIPDRLVVLPGGKAAFIETKTPTGRLSGMQKRWLKELDNLGFLAVATQDRDEIKNVLDCLLN